MRFLAVDCGERRVGLALSDERGVLALPYKTLTFVGDEATARLIAAEVSQAGVDEVVVGLPLQMDGREGDAARRARRLGTAIAQATSSPVIYWDERLTTVTAQRSLRALGVRGARQKQVIDQAAAALLLESYLARQRSQQPCHPTNPPQLLENVDDGDAQAMPPAAARPSRGGGRRSSRRR